MTLGDQLALAVLRGDRVAAYALADLLQEERERGGPQVGAAKALNRTLAVSGYEVYRWPEFMAFCKRAGILWDLNTKRMEFVVDVDEMLWVKHEYRGTDTGAQPDSSETTTLHNNVYRTRAPTANEANIIRNSAGEELDPQPETRRLVIVK